MWKVAVEYSKPTATTKNNLKQRDVVSNSIVEIKKNSKTYSVNTKGDSKREKGRQKKKKRKKEDKQKTNTVIQ